MKQKTAPVLERDTALPFPHALLISASAGSGKTYTLARRYVQFLLSEAIPANRPENILAVTFTNNAAKEMKTRILGWLKGLALDNDPAKKKSTLELVDIPPEKMKRKAETLVEEIINNYSDFHIQTIDSFLARVMSASVDELGLPLNPEITMAYDVLIDLSLSAMFSRIGSKQLPASEVDRFLAVLPRTGSYPWNPARRIRENFESFLGAEGRVSGEIILPEEGGDPDAVLREKFRAALDLCSSLRKKIKNDELIKKSSLSAIKNRDIGAFLSSYGFPYGIISGNKKSKITDEAVWLETGSLHDMVREMTELSAVSYYAPYVRIYSLFKAELERVKRGKNDVIHINDIAKKLAAYISASNVPEVYLKLGERVSHFLIDEFQDTNRLQWDNIRPLAEETLSKRGSLFAVGDIKQAIYMFRNADYRIMKDFLDTAEGKKKASENLSLNSLGGKIGLVNLPKNYRSDGVVLDYVNSLFREKLKNRPALIGEDATELTSCGQSVEDKRVSDGYVRTEIMEAGSGETPEKERLISIMEAARKRFPLNEIAVLVAKNKRIEPVVEWLTEKGIPVASLSSLDIRKRKVIAELISLLKFLESPADDLSLAGFITGDIFTRLTGLKRAEVFHLIGSTRISSSLPSGPPPLLYAVLKETPAFKKYWELYIEDLFKKVGYLPLYELVTLVFSKLRLFENFREESAFLARFLDAVIRLESRGVQSNRAFIEYARGEDENKTAVFSIALPDFMEAARVMTFHKSKGLGFSVVINLIYEERDDADAMCFEEKDGNIRVYRITQAAAENSDRLGPIYKARKRDEKIQDLNLLYVISTRARHELYNLVVKKARKTEAKEEKLMDIFENFEAGTPRPFPKIADTSPVKGPGKSSSFGLRDIVPKGLGKPEPVDVLQPEIIIPEGVRGGKPTFKTSFESAEGELYHEILAKIIDLPDDLEAVVADYYDSFSVKYPFKFNRAVVVNNIMAFFKSSQAAPIFDASKDRVVKTEAEFIDKTGSLFRMDRVLMDKDSVTVVDFKTGREDDEKYSGQMKNYMAIISEIHKKPVKGMIAYVDLRKITKPALLKN